MARLDVIYIKLKQYLNVNSSIYKVTTTSIYTFCHGPWLLLKVENFRNRSLATISTSQMKSGELTVTLALFLAGKVIVTKKSLHIVDSTVEKGVDGWCPKLVIMKQQNFLPQICFARNKYLLWITIAANTCIWQKNNFITCPKNSHTKQNNYIMIQKLIIQYISIISISYNN